ncbi:MAG: D-glycero-beta-D-manno-heptose 1,7-bisphosphate 7-phosphatase [Candidatus Omnitrophica bacterium]|nr:D-glycero-beta-D-manno-heptose 1,7-bisphosphate 7-phosphatase [Candidatus Omnitrophota bacterium]
MKKVIFLDRDGVINKDPGGWTEHSYVTTLDQLIFLQGSIEAVKKLYDAGYDIVVISNQAGISKGHYTVERLEEINSKMINALEKAGARLKKTYYCVHQTNDNCDCRKPKTGLFDKAKRELGIEIAGNFFVGDGKMDVEAGKKAGLRTILVLSGKSSMKDVMAWQIKPDFVFKDLKEAVQFILKGRET